MAKKMNILIYILIIAIIVILAIIITSNNKVTLEKIVLDKKLVSIYLGEKNMIGFTLSPSNASNKKIKWESNNPSVATVDDKGIITSVSVGEADIIVSSSDNSIRETCHVVVKSKGATGIDLSSREYSLKVGEKKVLYAAISPSSASTTSFVYQSSNSNVAMVDANGIIEAVASGEADIIVKDEQGLYEARCHIIVSPQLEKIELDRVNVELVVGKSDTLKTILFPSDIKDVKLTWSSSNSDIVKVNNSGAIYGKAIGEATITVKSNNIEASCKVVVKQRTVSVKGIVLDKKKITLDVGGKKGLIASVRPINADNQDIIWSSSDESVAVVDANGIVTAINGGTATITATSSDGGFSKPCTVVVRAQVQVTSPIVPSSYVDKYESSTLKFYIQNNSRYYLTYIWMEDPANQIRKMDAMTATYGKVMTDAEQDAQGLSRMRKTIGDIMNAYISNGMIPVGKAAVGFNGGGFYDVNNWTPPSLYYDKRSSSWLVYHNGLLTRNRFDDDKAPTDVIIGITGSGELKVYGSGADGVAKRQQIYNETVADKVKNTWAFNPLIIGPGVDSSWWDQSTAQRNAICQVNSNNYIMYTSANGSAYYGEMQSLFSSLGCKVAMNLDGGGSTSLFVKKPGETSVTKYKCGANPCRAVIEGIYFTEK